LWRAITNLKEDLWLYKKARNIDVQIHSVAVRSKLLKVLSRAAVEINPRAAVAVKKCSAPECNANACGGTQPPCALCLQLIEDNAWTI
jgi:hypothetical protein